MFITCHHVTWNAYIFLCTIILQHDVTAEKPVKPYKYRKLRRHLPPALQQQQHRRQSNSSSRGGEIFYCTYNKQDGIEITLEVKSPGYPRAYSHQRQVENYDEILMYFCKWVLCVSCVVYLLMWCVYIPIVQARWKTTVECEYASRKQEHQRAAGTLSKLPSWWWCIGIYYQRWQIKCVLSNFSQHGKYINKLQTTDNSQLHLKLSLYHQRSITESRTTLEYLTHISYLYIFIFILLQLTMYKIIWIYLYFNLATFYNYISSFCTMTNYQLKYNNNKNNWSIIFLQQINKNKNCIWLTSKYDFFEIREVWICSLKNV